MNHKITPGKTIGILSPSSSIVPERFEAGLSILEQRGFHLAIHSQTYTGVATGTQFAGTAEDKATALMDLYLDPDIDMIMASCGGNFSAQFLHLIDRDVVKNNPKPLMGFSDTTSLLSAIYSQTGLGGIFGPTVQTLGKIPDTEIDLTDTHVLRAGNTAPAPIFAGTLSVLMSLTGTPYFPNLKGHILVLEDIGEELSHLDRMLWQLDQICPLSTLAGLVFGEFVDTKDTGRPLGLEFRDILEKYTHNLNIPVMLNAPIGHGNTLQPIPIGRSAVLNATNRTLILL